VPPPTISDVESTFSGDSPLTQKTAPFTVSFADYGAGGMFQAMALYRSERCFVKFDCSRTISNLQHGAIEYGAKARDVRCEAAGESEALGVLPMRCVEDTAKFLARALFVVEQMDARIDWDSGFSN
jgi:hypothetical protein